MVPQLACIVALVLGEKLLEFLDSLLSLLRLKFLFHGILVLWVMLDQRLNTILISFVFDAMNHVCDEVGTGLSHYCGLAMCPVRLRLVYVFVGRRLLLGADAVPVEPLALQFLLRLELLAEQAELLETDLIVPVLMAGCG